jgi:uncharacterized protein
MFLKLLLVAIILYFIYRAFGGKISIPKKSTNKEKEIEENTLVECSKCGVYITYKEAIKKDGKIYCNECA